MPTVPRDLPTGTVTFLFSDVEGSTRLLHELGPDAYAAALAEHRRILREAFGAQGGVEVDTQGDAFFVAFPTAPGALAAARGITEGLQGGPIRVRIGLHTGTPLLTDEGYVGADVHRAARIAAAGHGGQVLLSAATVALTGTDGLHDVGVHRLKDLSAPERIYQLGETEFPALHSLFQSNLPIPSTPFLGRETELMDVEGLLSRPDVRLLTLTGSGGTGKTRLALQAAGAQADHYPHGVWWVPLAPLRDPTLVLPTARDALGAKGDVADFVGEKSMLLLFDNFEQVVAAASDLSSLLAACPRLDVLVTSRERLHLSGEQEYPVPTLLPDEGIAFFTARARAMVPDFQVDAAVPGICRRLDDLPLALELAAARIKALSTAQILERLEHSLPLLTGGARDLPERQRTLHATIAWSYDLLTPDEQRLFARFAVFVGGCTLESAEDVTEADLDTLLSLVDKSLLRHTEERFWMLETIHEYATERLEASGEATSLGRRHAEHYLALAEASEPSLMGVSPGASLDRLERDHNNVRAALDWFESSGHPGLALRLAGSIWEFWCLRGHPSEGMRRLEDLLDADSQPTQARAKALTGAAHLAPETSVGVETFKRRAEEALALYRQLGDPWGIAYAELQFAMAVAFEGDFAVAQPLVEESVRRLRELGDEHRALQALRLLVWCCEQLGEIERSKSLTEDLLRGARAARDVQMEARALNSLAMIADDEGDPGKAVALLEDAYRLDNAFGDPWEITVDLIRFARTLAFAGMAEPAAELLARSEGMRQEFGLTHPAYVTDMREDAEKRVRERLDEVVFAEAWKRGQALTPEEAVELAVSAL